MLPTLPRSSDLHEVGTVPPRSDGRDASGRFGSGNRASSGAHFKRSIRKSLGDRATEGDVRVVASDARRVFVQTLRSMPSDAPPVRSMVVLHARALALHGFFTVKAELAGLDSDRGIELLKIADDQSKRAERLLVTALDVARVCADKEAKSKPSGLAALQAIVSGGSKP